MLPLMFPGDFSAVSFSETDNNVLGRYVNVSVVHACSRRSKKMQQNQPVVSSPISEIAKLEPMSSFRLSETLGVPAVQLQVAANAEMPVPVLPVLLPGPTLVHIDGVCYFTPTELGRRLGLSAQKFNQLLMGHGLQLKRDGQWCPTEAGKALSVLLQVNKKQQAGTDVLQLKWKETVLPLLAGNG
ncbi:hypothetical protein ABE494_12025 [Stenotrophomonas lactitubi]|uniref:hypothetical protein n=1 Tax=Stenotrophomonas lactitubi TaxID=2045214 RepID=UPI00320990B9